MPNLSAARPIRQYGKADKPLRAAPVAASTTLYHGGMVGKNSGVVPASQSVPAIGVVDIESWDDVNAQGVSSGTLPTPTWPIKIDNSTGAEGARRCLVQQGVFAFDNKVADPVVADDVGANCYVEDDHTVRHTSSGSVVAGKVMGLTEDGQVLVKFSV